MKVALVFAHYGPYHLARASAAAKVMNLAFIELRARSRSYGWDPGASARSLPLISLPETGRKGREDRRLLEPVLAAALTKAQPEVVAVNGWGDFMSSETLRWCVRNGVPAIVMSESNSWDEPRKWHREWIKSRLVKMFSAGLVGGSPQKDYLIELGMPASSVEVGYNAVDNEHFADEAAKVREEWRVKGDGTARPEVAVENDESRAAGEGLRGKSGPRESGLYFLASARFIPKKNLGRLIEAYAQYCRASAERGVGSGESRVRRSEAGDRMSEASRSAAEPKMAPWQTGCRAAKDQRSETEERRSWDLVLLGDGPMCGELVRKAMDLGLEVREGAPWESAEGVESGELRVASEGTDFGDRMSDLGCQRPEESDGRACGVLWLSGFRQIGELPRFYAGAGCFIHASTTEQWGLVVNEAMACGLPVIVSERCGCARDLVQDGVNGFRFDPRNVAQLAELMGQVSDQAFPRADFGEASRRIVADFGPERFAHGLKAAASHALKKGAHRPSLLERLILDLVCRR